MTKTINELQADVEKADANLMVKLRAAVAAAYADVVAAAAYDDARKKLDAAKAALAEKEKENE
jgi:hypothetical protein